MKKRFAAIFLSLCMVLALMPSAAFAAEPGGQVTVTIPIEITVDQIGDGVPGKIVEPKLTTVHFYYKTSGMEAAAMLADLIENDTGISKEIKMGCELVERESHR